MKNKKWYYLNPIHDSSKSFYRKAIVSENCTFWGADTLINAENEKHLYSYNSHVCYIDCNNMVHLLGLWCYSPTTLRHVKEFLKQNGFRADTKQQIIEDYL